MANQEPTRAVADRFDITLSSVNRVLQRVSQAAFDLSGQYIQWPNGELYGLWSKKYKLTALTTKFLKIILQQIESRL